VSGLSGWCSQLGRPNHAGCRVHCACACHGRVEIGLPTTSPAQNNGAQETTNASRPRIKGAGTPTRGLADRLETTDS
jgi:hypothetical protein